VKAVISWKTQQGARPNGRERALRACYLGRGSAPPEPTLQNQKPLWGRSGWGCGDPGGIARSRQPPGVSNKPLKPTPEPPTAHTGERPTHVPSTRVLPTPRIVPPTILPLCSNVFRNLVFPALRRGTRFSSGLSRHGSGGVRSTPLSLHLHRAACFALVLRRATAAIALRFPAGPGTKDPGRVQRIPVSVARRPSQSRAACHLVT
jgi:hypothetical protein